MLVVQSTSPGGKLRGVQTPLRATRIGKPAWMMAQLPNTGQVPTWLPVQHTSGVLAAVQMRFGSQALHRSAPALPAPGHSNPLRGPPTQLRVPPQVLPGQSVLVPQPKPAFTPATQVPRQLPADPPPGAMIRERAPDVGVIVAVKVAGAVGVMVGVSVIVGVSVTVGVSVGVLVSPGCGVSVGVSVGVLVTVGGIVLVGVGDGGSI